MTTVSLPNLLLGLGTALVIVAAIVFTAVQWSHLSSAVQALVLLGLTVGTGWATGALRRHGLTATGEALSVIAVAMLLVDVHAVREAAGAVRWGEDLVGDPLVYWCVATWVVAGFTLWFGRMSETRAPRIIAAVAAQVPVPLYVVARPVEAISGQLLCLAQVALVVMAIHHAPRAATWARRAGALGAAGTWFVVTPVAAAMALAGGPMERVGGAGVLATAAAVAGLVAALWSGDETIRVPALGTATVAGLAAAWIAVSAVVTGEAWWPLAAALCAAVLLGSVQLPRRWGDPSAVVAAVLGGLASIPLAGVVLDALATVLAAGDPAWDRSMGASVRSMSDPVIDLPAGGVVVAHVGVLAVAMVGVSARIGRRTMVHALSVLACVAVLVAPLVFDLTVGVAVGLALLAAAVAMIGVVRPGGGADARRVAAPAGLGILALLWAAATPTTTLLALGVVGALAAGLAICAVRDGSGNVALTAAAAAVTAVVAEAGLAAVAAGATSGAAGVTAGLVAAGATLVASAASRRTPTGRRLPDEVPATAGEADAAPPARAVLINETWVTAQATGVALHLVALALVASAGPVALSVLVAATALLGIWFLRRALQGAAMALAQAATATVAVAVCAEAGLVTAALGGTGGEAWLAVGLAAAVTTLAAATVDRPGTRIDLLGVVGPAARGSVGGPTDPADEPGDRRPSGATDVRGAVAALGEGTAAGIHLVALVATASLSGAGASSVLLAVGAATAAVHALRPGRRPAVVWAATEAVVLVWVRLAVADIEVAEAYTVPVALAFLAAALVAHRTGLAERYSSWTVHGPWLVMALAPTVLLALGDPGVVRPLGGLVAGVLVLVGGALTRWRAPVDIGVTTVVVLGLRQLALVVAELPNWATVGACGLLLLVVGATFEQRRRELKAIRDRYANLG